MGIYTAMILFFCAPLILIGDGLLVVIKFTFLTIATAIIIIVCSCAVVLCFTSVLMFLDSLLAAINERKDQDDKYLYYLLAQARTHSAWQRSHHTGEVGAFFNLAEGYDSPQPAEPKVLHLRSYAYKRESNKIPSYLSKIL